MNDEGVIKFTCRQLKTKAVRFEDFEELNRWRQILHDKGLIGENDEGIGYGNISMRGEEDQFFISGSATGGIITLGPENYSLVESFDLEHNSLVCKGAVKASSESMSHGALYRMSNEIKAVVHIHHLGMWDYYIDKLPTTKKDVAYGTPEMAFEIQRLYRESELPKVKAMVMGGHREGLISFGSSIKEASELILDYYSNMEKS
jgi:L-ribulose-5-phosphate 4-epimerase